MLELRVPVKDLQGKCQEMVTKHTPVTKAIRKRQNKKKQ